MTATLTKDEEIFLRRALPHFLAGKSVADAMRAVLDDDARILNAALSHRGQVLMQSDPDSPTGGRTAWLDSNPAGTNLRTLITQSVYSELRAA